MAERVAVIIPARNAPLLPRTLVSLAQQRNAPPLEIVVVGDRAPAGVTQPADVRFVPTPGPVTSPVARNIGIRSTGAEWLAFIDADCEAAPDWAAALLRAGQQGHAVVGGGVRFGRCGYWASVHNLSMLHDYHISAPAGPRPFLPSLNLLVHRQVIEQVGMMDEALRRAQDLEWTARMYRAGITPWFEPRATVTHFPDRGFASLWRDYFETGRNSYQVRALRADRLALPAGLRSPVWLRVLAPAIAAAATARIYLKRPALARHLALAPGVWLTKLAWSLGAADGSSR